jgi:hypothetical protein
MMTFGQIPRNMAEILIEPSSTSVESVSEFVKRSQGFVTSAVTSIYQGQQGGRLVRKQIEGWLPVWCR